MKTDTILNKARESISSFCIEECKSYCCRKGYLVLTENELMQVAQGKKEELDKLGLLKEINGKFSLYLGKYDMPCPSLKDFKCMIHQHKPQVCRDFPIFLKDKEILLSPRCLAVKENKFYPYIKKLLSMGYTLGKKDPMADIELYAVTLR